MVDGYVITGDTYEAYLKGDYNEINFIKTGNPNSEALPYWTVYRQDAPTVMHMKEGFFLAPVPNKQQADFLEKYFENLRKAYGK